MDYHEIFTYNCEDGCLYWRRKDPSYFKNYPISIGWNKRYEGKRAGCTRKRYAGNGMQGVYIKVGDKFVAAHTIVWTMHNGPLPKGMVVDHIDRDATNNRIANLRLATASQNSMNITTPQGVLRGLQITDNGKWVARIMVRGKAIRLGTFETKGLTAVARCKATLRYHGKFSHFLS